MIRAEFRILPVMSEHTSHTVSLIFCRRTIVISITHPGLAYASSIVTSESFAGFLKIDIFYVEHNLAT